MYLDNITFHNLPIFWKTLIIIGIISIFIFFILLLIIVSLMFENKLSPKKENKEDLEEFNDFLNEFNNGKNQIKDEDDYPILPKIKDFDGNLLKNLMQIDIL